MASVSMSFGDPHSSLQLGTNHGTINFSPGQPEASQEDKDNEILRSLAFPQMLDRRDNIERCHANTCEWILETEEYKTWLRSNRGLLWIKGKPGAGKSTLMAFIHDKLEKLREHNQHGGIQLNFFFTARGVELQKTPVGMFRSLLNQIFALDVNVRNAVRETYEKRCLLLANSNEHKWAQTVLEKLLTDAIITSAKQQQVRVFVDALDEAGARSAQQLAAYFHRISTHAQKENAFVQICISCRHYPITSNSQSIEICMEKHNQRDIAMYIDDFLTDMENQEDIAEIMKVELLGQLTERANGVFQWAHIMVHLLQQRILDGDSLDEVSSWLNEVPADLEEVYTYILSNVIEDRNRQQSFLLFQWVCFAERPLTLTEIRYALVAGNAQLSSPPKAWEKLEGFVDSDKRMKRKLKALSGGLVEVVAGRVNHEISNCPLQLIQVVHQSVNDFISTKGLELLHRLVGKSTSIKCDELLFSQSHATLYRACLVYIASAEMPRLLMNLGLGQNYPFLEYAVKNLFFHAERSAESRAHTDKNEFDALQRLFDRWLDFRSCFSDGNSETQFPPENTKLLHMAAFYNLVDVVERMASNSETLEGKDYDGNTAFNLAARGGHLTVAKILQQHGADSWAENKKRESPLVEVAKNGNLEFVAWLLSGEKDRGKAAYYGSFGLPGASRSGHHAVVAMLIEAGADVNSQSLDNCTALGYACWYGHIEVVRLLLDANADVNARDDTFGNALKAAARQGHLEIVRLLLDVNADVNARDDEWHETALYAASEEGHVEIVRLLLHANADVNLDAQNDGSDSALQIAACAGNVEVIRLLLQANADVNAQGGQFGSALRIATQCGHTEIVRLLLHANADVNARCDRSGTALETAAERGRVEIVRWLIQANADVNAKGVLYCNALHAAESMGHPNIVQILLDAGARGVQLDSGAV